MQKRTIALFVILIAVFAAFKFCNNKPDVQPQEKQSPLAIGENSGSFNTSFNQLLSSYYAVKDALVASDSAKANSAALELCPQFR